MDMILAYDAAVDDTARNIKESPFQLFGVLPVYNVDSMKRRHALREHTELQIAVEAFWRSPDLKKDKFGLTKESYMRLNFKLHKVLVPLLDHMEAHESTEMDWENDANAPNRINYKHFFVSMCKLADIWCEDPSPTEYAKFLARLLEAVFEPRGKDKLPFFREDKDIVTQTAHPDDWRPIPMGLALDRHVALMRKKEVVETPMSELHLARDVDAFRYRSDQGWGCLKTPKGARRSKSDDHFFEEQKEQEGAEGKKSKKPAEDIPPGLEGHTGRKPPAGNKEDGEKQKKQPEGHKEYNPKGFYIICKKKKAAHLKSQARCEPSLEAFNKAISGPSLDINPDPRMLDRDNAQWQKVADLAKSEWMRPDSDVTPALPDPTSFTGCSSQLPTTSPYRGMSTSPDPISNKIRSQWKDAPPTSTGSKSGVSVMSSEFGRILPYSWIERQRQQEKVARAQPLPPRPHTADALATKPLPLSGIGGMSMTASVGRTITTKVNVTQMKQPGQCGTPAMNWLTQSSSFGTQKALRYSKSKVPNPRPLTPKSSTAPPSLNFEEAMTCYEGDATALSDLLSQFSDAEWQGRRGNMMTQSGTLKRRSIALDLPDPLQSGLQNVNQLKGFFPADRTRTHELSRTRDQTANRLAYRDVEEERLRREEAREQGRKPTAREMCLDFVRNA
jgi:hypothetical protein